MCSICVIHLQKSNFFWKRNNKLNNKFKKNLKLFFMLKVGITGGIGSGKSVVSDIIRLLGYPVYSSDERAKELSDTNAHIRKALVALFGDDMYEDNHLNRTLLASSIFSDTTKIAEVNAIIHPVVFADFNQWCKEQTSRLVFAESAIIVESGFSVFMDTTFM